MSQYHTLDTREQIDNFLLVVAKRRAKGQSTCVKFDEPESHITQAQFSAMHVWCGQVADQLNACGLDIRLVIKPDISIDWDKDSVKRLLYKPVLKAMTGKTSTTEQNTVQPSAVAETIARHIAERFDIPLPMWPDRHGTGQ